MFEIVLYIALSLAGTWLGWEMRGFCALLQRTREDG